MAVLQTNKPMYIYLLGRNALESYSEGKNFQGFLDHSLGSQSHEFSIHSKGLDGFDWKKWITDPKVSSLEVLKSGKNSVDIL